LGLGLELSVYASSHEAESAVKQAHAAVRPRL
jgi:hypothetical protein